MTRQGTVGVKLLSTIASCFAGQMQVPAEGRCDGAEGAWRQQLVARLRQAVLRGQTVNVRHLLGQGAPLVTDAVSNFIALLLIVL